MQTPRKRNSEIVNILNKQKNPFETQRYRTSMLLAARIIKGFKALGWNKVQFAEAINQKPSVITRWISGTHNFTSDTLSDIELVLGIELIAHTESKFVLDAECGLTVINNSYKIRKEIVREEIADLSSYQTAKVLVSVKSTKTEVDKISW
jgi:ribosome-binding protein aMBF1 (putative translation factor)